MLYSRFFCFYSSSFSVDDMCSETIEAAKKIISKKSKNDSQGDIENIMQRIKNIEGQLASIGQFDNHRLRSMLPRWSECCCWWT